MSKTQYYADCPYLCIPVDQLGCSILQDLYFETWNALSEN